MVCPCRRICGEWVCEDWVSARRQGCHRSQGRQQTRAVDSRQGAKHCEGPERVLLSPVRLATLRLCVKPGFVGLESSRDPAVVNRWSKSGVALHLPPHSKTWRTTGWPRGCGGSGSFPTSGHGEPLFDQGACGERITQERLALRADSPYQRSLCALASLRETWPRRMRGVPGSNFTASKMPRVGYRIESCLPTGI